MCNPREFLSFARLHFIYFFLNNRSQLSPEPSLLHGFEDEVVVQRSKKHSEATLPDLLLSSTYAGTSASKSAPTPRVYVENQSRWTSTHLITTNPSLRRNLLPREAKRSRSTFREQDRHITFRRRIHRSTNLPSANGRSAETLHSSSGETNAWGLSTNIYLHSRHQFGLCIVVLHIRLCFYSIECLCFLRHISIHRIDFPRSVLSISGSLHSRRSGPVGNWMIRLMTSLSLSFASIDPVKFNQIIFSESISLQNCAAALLFYAVAMVVNLVMMQTEDTLRMTQYTNTTTNVTALIVREIPFERSA